MGLASYFSLPLVSEFLSLAIGLTLIARFPVRRSLVIVVAAVAVLLVFASIAIVFWSPVFGFDYRQIFWPVGRDVWQGVNPYATDRFHEHPFLHPPTALPVFATFAVVPLEVSIAIWTIANVVAVCALVFFVQRVLLAQEAIRPTSGEPNRWKLPGFVLVGLTASLAASAACLTGFYTGQLSVCVTLMLLAALDAQRRGHPLRAGLWLALASIKITTLLPFLLLFTRWADRRSWISLAGGVTLLTFVATPPTQLPERLQLMLEHIRELQEPGKVNDYTFEGTQHTTILGLDHALYRLGMRHRGWIQATQYILLAGLGVGVASQVFPPGRIPRAAACSLVAAFSAIFLYHRVYDTVALAIPLVYCTGLSRNNHGSARWVLTCAAVAILLVLHLPKDSLIYLTDLSFKAGPFGWLIQAIVLPYATWCVLLVMICIVVGARLTSNESHAVPETTGRS